MINGSATNESFSQNGDDELNKLVKLYVQIDALGISTNVEIKSNDKYALDILEKTSRYVNGSWEVGLLWKSDLGKFPDGRSNALRRLHLLEKKLDRDANYAEMYHPKMNRLLDEGFAQKVLN